MKEPKIVRTKDTCFGKPRIEGTRIKVSHITVEFEHMGMSPDQIVQAHPHLNLAQVHAALAYYYQHTEDIKKEIKEDNEYIAQLKKSFNSKLKLEYA